MASDRSLVPSILTSSSIRDLPEFIIDVTSVSRIEHFDIMVLREADLRALEKRHPTFQYHSEEPMASIVANNANLAPIAQWLVETMQECQARVAALATYFPGISSADENIRKIAVSAVVNCVLIGDVLKAEGFMDVPIVEIVGGSLVERCQCMECEKDNVVLRYRRDLKADLLARSLAEAVLEVNRIRKEQPFGIALEMEPGETYVVNGLDAMKSVLERVEDELQIQPSIGNSDQAATLAQHVGLNVDIAHMRIRGVEAKELMPLAGRIQHAHIADHPGLHTHDSVPGTYTSIEGADGGYLPYIRLLSDRAMTDDQRSPFSAAVAIELEGCNRILDAYDSVARLNHVLLYDRRLRWLVQRADSHTAQTVVEPNGTMATLARLPSER